MDIGRSKAATLNTCDASDRENSEKWIRMQPSSDSRYRRHARSSGDGCHCVARSRESASVNRADFGLQRRCAIERDPEVRRTCSSGSVRPGARRSPLVALFRNSIIFAARIRVYLRQRPVWKCVKFKSCRCSLDLTSGHFLSPDRDRIGQLRRATFAARSMGDLFDGAADVDSIDDSFACAIRGFVGSDFSMDFSSGAAHFHRVLRHPDFALVRRHLDRMVDRGFRFAHRSHVARHRLFRLHDGANVTPARPQTRCEDSLVPFESTGRRGFAAAGGI